MNIIYTDHAQVRKSQRGIEDDAILLTLTHGKKYYRTGVIFYFLDNKSICQLRDDGAIVPDFYEGTTLITKNDRFKNIIITTVYRNKYAIKDIKKKKKRSGRILLTMLNRGFA